MISPHCLTCQRVTTPMGLAGSPTFSWKNRSQEKNQWQTGYRLQVGTSPELLGDVLDTGKVSSPETLDIPWTGPALEPCSRFYWAVTVWDQDDVSATSPVTWFETGPRQEDFLGKTIYAGDSPDKPYEKTSFATTAPALDMPVLPFTDAPEGPPPEMPDFSPKPQLEYYFRKEFSLPNTPLRARLYLTASGPCLVRLNGNPAGEWLHDPSPNACSFRPLYTSYDITEGLQPGSNALAISSSGKNITVLILLDWGSEKTLLASHPDWHWTVGPTQMIGTGETYDAAQELINWDLPGFDDSRWAPCQIGPDPLTVLYPNQMHVQKVVWQEHPATIEKTPWGTFRCKASRISAGRVRFRLSAPRGTEIKLYLAEKELKNGEILRGTDPLGNPEEGGSDCFTYIFKGEGTEEWAPRYSYSGIGWLEIQGYPGEITPEDIWFEAILNDTPRISSMESSEPMFTKLHEMLIDTIQNNFHGVLTTCPPYEKGPADGDTSVTLPAFLWNLDCLPIVRRLDDDFAATVRFRRSYTLEDLQNDRVAPGMIRTVPEWSSMLIHNCVNLKDFSGLSSEFTDFYEELQRYFRNEMAELEFSDYLVDSFFGGDWNSPDGNGAPEGGTLSGTCYEYFSFRTMAEMCRKYGKPEDAQLYESYANRIRDSINEKCFLGDEYQTARKQYHPAWGPPPWDGKGKAPLDVGYRQTSNLLPLAFGIVPEESRDAVKERLSREIEKNGNHFNSGYVGLKYLLTTLSDLGYLEQAYEVATQHSYPSWGWWIDQGATTCWEQWGTFSRSYDHYFLAAGPEDWFRETLAGIRDQKDGFKTFTIRPQIPEKLQYFSMTSDTPRGTVSSRWEKTASGLQITVEIPVGSTAQVILPVKPGQTVLLEDAPTPETTFSLGSGIYHFTLKG